MDKLQIIIEWTRCLCFNLKKCVAFALGDLRSQGGKSYGPFDPKLTFQGKPFKYLADDLHKFLGRLLAIAVSNHGAYDQTLKDFLTTAPLNGSSKAWIYEFYVNAKILSWPFLIYPFAVSSIQKDFEAPATKFLKKWFKLAKPANPAILFLPKSQNGLGITAPVDKFKSLQVSAAHQLRSSVDPSISALVSPLQPEQPPPTDGLRSLNLNKLKMKLTSTICSMDTKEHLVLVSAISAELQQMCLFHARNKDQLSFLA